MASTDGYATCSCGTVHTATADTQAKADAYAAMKARACAENDRLKKVYEAAQQRRQAELDKQRREAAERSRAAEARRQAAQQKRKKS